MDESSPPTPARAPSIMLIEDDDDIREALSLLLENQNYVVAAFSGATEALAALREGCLPDVILLDLNMPEMDGWEFRVQQKREAASAGIPVIALSADSSAKAAAIDAHAYLIKPVDPRILIETIARLLATLEREQLLARQKELERLSSLGVLATGIAHELNDPLSFVLGNLQLAERKLRELEARLGGADAFSLVGIRQVLARAKRGAERISAVVSSVSMFAHSDTEERTTIDVNELLESTLRLASNEIRHVAKLERALEPVPQIVGNRAKLGRVLLNLILNAVHAIESTDPRDHVLRVATSVSPHREVIVSISDTGPGIAPEQMPRVFDPFFALRAAGSSVGLGLSITRELVSELSGTIEVESKLHQGSVFRVTLPSRALPPLDDTAHERPPSIVPARKRPRVLVIDDEPLLCSLVADMLAAPYDVITESSAKSALALLRAEHFDAILCDLMMPELSGMDLYDQIAHARPGIEQRFVFITGGGFTERARDFLASTRRPQLRKPFRQEDVIDAIEALLAAR